MQFYYSLDLAGEPWQDIADAIVTIWLSFIFLMGSLWKGSDHDNLFGG